jgi:hypothetical protein
MYESTTDGIRFIEGRPKNATVLSPIKVEVGGVFRQAQLKNLNDLKHEMARIVISRGGNSVIDFKYGQRTVGFFKSLLQLDDINWYGEGWIAVVS